MRVKYAFTAEEPRRRILTLMRRIMNELAHEATASTEISWTAYEASLSHQLSEMDDALFEVAHFVAEMTRVDGTVLMTDSLEVLGFGVEIAGELPRSAASGAGARSRRRSTGMGANRSYRHASSLRLSTLPGGA
jgi:hypothetical protein